MRFIGLLLIICLATLPILALEADNKTPCLTKEQARAKWPEDLIFWHGANHCWDNERGTAATASMADGTVKIIRAPKPNRAIKASREDMPAPLIDASGNAVRTR